MVFKRIARSSPQLLRSAIAVLPVMLILAGCASRYRLTEQQASRVNTMSEQQAYAILHSVVEETPQAGGLCATNANWIRTEPKVIGFDGAKVRFIDLTAYVKSVDSKVTSFGGGSRSVSVNTVYGFDVTRFYFDFKTVSKVRIVADWVMQSGGACRHQASNKALGIFDAKGFFINIDVPKEKLDDVVLAITKLAPNATFIEGSGL